VVLALLKVQIACHFPKFGKISEMKNISKPRLAIEIYTFGENISTYDFRKYPFPALL
jgi:hypothetical protein